MALALGNLLGGVTKIASAFSDPRSLKDYLNNFNKFGVQTKNNFEVNFSGIADATLFVTGINTPEVTQNFNQVKYNGRAVDIPTKVDYGHDITMTVLNDGKGYIYTALLNFLKAETATNVINSGFTLVIKSVTGDPEYPGMVITCNGCRMMSISGLQFGYSDNDVSTFEVGFKIIDFTVTNGSLGKVAGVLGGLNSLFS